ncbi:STAS domain-containing protein [Noviherbaspirillum agri]
MTASRQNASTTVRVQGELNIYRAAELKEALLAQIAPGAALEIDLSGVTELDTAGLQVLMLAKNTARALGTDMKLVAHSPAVVDVLELLNLSAWFGDQVVISPSPTSFAR